jgi:hypothetical protein
VAQKAGLEDSVDETLTYVAAIAADHPELFAPDMAREWIEGAIEAARWFEDVGAIAWQMIPGYEHCMPHTILVNRAGDRFCDDSFHPAVIKGVMASTADGLVSSVDDALASAEAELVARGAMPVDDADPGRVLQVDSPGDSVRIALGAPTLPASFDVSHEITVDLGRDSQDTD